MDETVAPEVFYTWLCKSSYADSVYAVEEAGRLAGFGVIKQYYDRRVFSRTAEPGYFLLPEFTGKGAGSRLLETMESDAKKIGIRNFVVSISSLNPDSIKFHEKRGFVKCAAFASVGHKLGRDFDVVWLQKIL